MFYGQTASDITIAVKPGGNRDLRSLVEVFGHGNDGTIENDLVRFVIQGRSQNQEPTSKIESNHTAIEREGLTLRRQNRNLANQVTAVGRRSEFHRDEGPREQLSGGCRLIVAQNLSGRSQAKPERLRSKWIPYDQFVFVGAVRNQHALGFTLDRVRAKANVAGEDFAVRQNRVGIKGVTGPQFGQCRGIAITRDVGARIEKEAHTAAAEYTNGELILDVIDGLHRAADHRSLGWRKCWKIGKKAGRVEGDVSVFSGVIVGRRLRGFDGLDRRRWRCRRRFGDHRLRLRVRHPGGNQCTDSQYFQEMIHPTLRPQWFQVRLFDAQTGCGVAGRSAGWERENGSKNCAEGIEILESKPQSTFAGAGFMRRFGVVAVLLVAVVAWELPAGAGDIKIHIPKRSHLTPVQRLNREGVEAIRKHKYEKAEAIFYHAYLLDPNDPFTLSNLGYISELKGLVDRAERFYALAAQGATDAVIDLASSKRVQGRSVNEALAIPDTTLQMNHDNVEAVRLLSQGRAPEADLLLQRTLQQDPRNIFTLNNLGVAKEMEGESQEALKYYDYAAASQSDASAIVTLDRSWRGRPISEMAAQNAKNLRTRLEAQNSLTARVEELNSRGVSALNRNDVSAAMQDFKQAYQLDPQNAFALNNYGYLSELQGDRETAQFFYDSALRAGGANLNVGLATRQSAEGLKLFQVAGDNNQKVENQLTLQREARRRQGEPVLLRRRDNSIVVEPTSPPKAPQNPGQPQ